MKWSVLALVVGLVLGIVAVKGRRRVLARVVVQHFQAGLLYRNGVFVRRLGPGALWLLPLRSTVTLVDTRRRVAIVPGQEVLSRDNVAVKASVALTYEVGDPEAAVHRVESYADALYLAAQLALREAVGRRSVEELLERRQELGGELLQAVAPQAREFGLAVRLVEVRDVTFPGELKRIFAEVVRAQKEGQAALERARGETAALRSLANAARMMADNPMLLNLRILQSLSGTSAGQTPTLVLGLPQGLVVPGNGKTAAAPGPAGRAEPGSTD